MLIRAPLLHLLSVILALLGVLCCPSAIAAEAADARVLFINSYNRGYSWSDGIEDGLRERLNASGKKIELSVEYLDSRRFGYGAQIEPLAQAMAAKYTAYRPDLIVVSDNAAFDFAIKHRARLFPTQPIVFCGYNSFRPEVIKGVGNITGVNEEIAIDDTVIMALKLHPKTRTLAFVVSTADASSKRIYEVAEQSVFPELSKRFEVVVLKDASVEQIRQRLAALPKETVLFLSGQASDQGNGRALTPAENGSLITAVSPFPTYTFWDFHLNRGVVGGHIITGPEQGRKAAEMALSILGGLAADRIPVVMTTPTQEIFDYPVMARFGITPESLPPGAVIINRPFSLWDTYRWQIVGLIGLLLFETALIGLLLHVARSRRAALAELAKAKEAAEAANIAKSAFLANMSHEMRTPLHQISGLAQLVRHEPLTPKQADKIEKLGEATHHLTILIDTILELTRLEARKTELLEAPIDCEAVVRGAVKGVQEKALAKQLPVIVETTPLASGLLGDEVHIRMALTNYLNNAIRFTQSGQITVRLQRVEEDNERVLVRFEVEDTGIGIAEEDQHRLFHIFEQVDMSSTKKFGGIGLGLAITKKIAAIMGGEAGCRSKLGEGSTFWFTVSLKKS